MPKAGEGFGFFGLGSTNMPRRRRWGRTSCQNHFVMDVWGIWRLNSRCKGKTMKAKRTPIQIWLLCAGMLPAVAQGQFTFTTNNGAITITGYTGFGGDVVIPDSTNGYPIVSIGDSAFDFSRNLTSVTIPNGVTSIGDAFDWCTSLN